jgi:hypothetical protein
MLTLYYVLGGLFVVWNLLGMFSFWTHFEVLGNENIPMLSKVLFVLWCGPVTVVIVTLIVILMLYMSIGVYALESKKENENESER